MKKQGAELKLCRTVGALIAELEKLPKTAKLDDKGRIAKELTDRHITASVRSA